MSKQHTTMKAIRNNWNKVFRVGYCDLHYIFHYEEPQYYNRGVYGWNCDVYCDYSRDIAITTGYRNMAGQNIPSELINKYSKMAEDVYKDYLAPYEEVKAKITEIREKFLDELDKL